MDVTKDSAIVELSGEPNKLDALIELLAPYGITELTRTGVTALSRGGKGLKE